MGPTVTPYFFGAIRSPDCQEQTGFVILQLDRLTWSFLRFSFGSGNRCIE